MLTKQKVRDNIDHYIANPMVIGVDQFGTVNHYNIVRYYFQVNDSGNTYEDDPNDWVLSFAEDHEHVVCPYQAGYSFGNTTNATIELKTKPVPITASVANLPLDSYSMQQPNGLGGWLPHETVNLDRNPTLAITFDNETVLANSGLIDAMLKQLNSMQALGSKVWVFEYEGLKQSMGLLEARKFTRKAIAKWDKVKLISKEGT